jgi:hypothetical protein
MLCVLWLFKLFTCRKIVIMNNERRKFEEILQGCSSDASEVSFRRVELRCGELMAILS